MNKKDLILWITLVGLTLLGYFSSESAIGKPMLVFALLAVTAIKFLGVGFQFMELKKAHAFWKVSFVAFFVLFGILVLVLS